MCARVHLHALWGKVGGDFLRQQVQSPGLVRHQLVSTKPTAGFLTAHRRARTPVRVHHQPPKTPENELRGRGRGGDGSWQCLGRFGPRLQRCSQAGRGSAFRPAHGQEEEGALGSVTGSEARDGDSCARGLRRGRGQVAQGWAWDLCPFVSLEAAFLGPGTPTPASTRGPACHQHGVWGILSDAGRAPGKHPPWREAL